MNTRNFFSNIYIKNLLIAVFIFIILVFIVLWWLDSYTHHGKKVIVPDVKGLRIADAAPLIERQTLQYVVIDSSYVKNKLPGSILETIPPVGTSVKEGRTIYITVNSYIAQMLIVPNVKDMSQRQAFAMLKSVGFEQVNIRIVPGAFQDLVLGLETGGQTVTGGDRIPADVPLILLVSSGQEETPFPEEDEILLDNDSEESWF
ncbi:MAG: PASTA domain-containing protein [Dysgonamonadaceae bacterium]|jgi:beta-lactam-binding protein with PASTA domain|nr:PASTA domain-containing protein [Dysgonamonadaceae bacterium]